MWRGSLTLNPCVDFITVLASSAKVASPSRNDFHSTVFRTISLHIYTCALEHLLSEFDTLRFYTYWMSCTQLQTHQLILAFFCYFHHSFPIIRRAISHTNWPQ